MSKKKFSDSIRGKGYYIALILCAVAIGITGYLYYHNTQPEAAQPLPVSAQPLPQQAQATTQPSTAGTESAEQTQPQLPQTRCRPVEGQIVAGFAVDALAYNPTTRDWRTHEGIDIAAQAGTQVCAAADGTVYTVYEDETMGTSVVIRHQGGYSTRYSSLAEEVSVKPGQQVSAGQTIGTVGNTALLENAIGDHLHFSVSCDGRPVDPEVFLEQ